jgi:TonB family protein
LYSDEQVLKVHDQKKGGVKRRCVIAKRDVFQRTLCFDDRGLLTWVEVTDTKIHHRFEYSDYDKFGERQFPHSMRVLENKRSVREARVEDLSVLAAEKPGFFAHSQDAQRISGCDSPEPEKVVKKVPPHYPSEARAAYVQGTNLMYVMVAEDGTVSNVRVLQTAGAALDDASVFALKQWTYRPAMCGANPVPIETEGSISYTLN